MRHRHTLHFRTVAAAIALASVAAGCSGSSDAAPAETLPVLPTVINSTTSTAPTTVAPTTSTSSTTTTTAATTVPPTLPTPVAPPEDPYAPEAEVVLGTIEIPKLGVSKTLYSGVSLYTLDKGPGHWPGTALPGQFGNVVVGAHRTSKDRPFRYVDQLVAGDEVVFTTTDGVRHVYKVTSIEIVTPDRIDIIDQRPGYFATLFACHPVGSTRERIIVHLELSV